MHKLGRRGLVIGLLLFGMAACQSSGSSTGTTPTPNAVPRYESASCPFPVDSSLREGKDVTCGFLVVHADHNDATSPNIRLAVAVFKNPSATKATDPVIYLDGGPGGGALDDFGRYISASNRMQFLGNRDLILLDQRGTGYSTPSLACAELNNLVYQTDQNYTAQQSVDLQNQALTTCHTRFVGQSINLNDYTTYQNAADVHDLITAMKIPALNLWGISYGTRLALEIMRSFPQNIRSVLLDSTVPAQLGLLENLPYDTARVFGKLFDGCAADASCNARYPNLATTFYTLYDTLSAKPVSFQATDVLYTGKTYTVVFNGDALENLLYTMFYDTSAIKDMPLMITQIQNGNYSLASQYYGELEFDTSVSYGMYFSVECAEDVNSVTKQQVDTASQQYPEAIRADQQIDLEGELVSCQIWHVATAPTTESQPVTSSIPTLVLEGEYDPITPPSNGDLAAKTLSHSYTFLFPGTGHGVFLTNPCEFTIRTAFQTSPQQKPDGSCVSTVTEPQFT